MSVSVAEEGAAEAEEVEGEGGEREAQRDWKVVRAVVASAWNVLGGEDEVGDQVRVYGAGEEEEEVDGGGGEADFDVEDEVGGFWAVVVLVGRSWYENWV